MKRSCCLYWVVAFALILSIPLPAHSALLNETEEDEKVVRNIRFVGNDNIATGELQSVIRTRTNRRVLGIPGATLWYGMYRLSGGRFGEEPTLLDREVVGRDIERLKNHYESQGYLTAEIDTLTVELNENRVEVSFTIEEGPQAMITEVIYNGLPEFDNDQIKRNFFRRSELIKSEINDTTYTSDLAFTFDHVVTERRRIINFLQNQGYASVQRDSVLTVVRQESDDDTELEVMFKINPGRVYHFGDLYLNVYGPDETNNPDTEENVYEGPPYALEGHTIYMSRAKSGQIRAGPLLEHILFKPGERYNHALYNQTVNQYQNLDMMSVRQFGLSSDGTSPDFTQDHLPVRIDLQTLPRHRIRGDLFGMQRAGFGAGAGLTYTNNNIFGGSEVFDIGVKGSFEYVGDSGALSGDQNFLRSLEISPEYTVPRLNAPFFWLNNRPNFYNTRTRYTLSLSQVRQQNFNINANIRFINQFEVFHNNQLSSQLNLIELDWVDAEATEEFIEQLRERVRDPIQIERILDDFNPQFNSVFRYTLRNIDTNPIQRDYGFFQEVSVEFGGTLPWIFDQFIFSPGDLTGEVPALYFSGSELSYSQFVKGSLDFRRYNEVLENGVFAWRAFAGTAYPFGKNPQIPLNRRFFAGGSNDIRGWPAFTLGPGNVDPDTDVPFNGGEIKLAGFLEYRHIFLHQFLNTDWGIAFFSDFGNTWYGPRTQAEGGNFRIDEFYEQIAVGGGFGLRLDWHYVVFRIDMAYRIHDLQDGWLQDDTPFLHFGIGHSF